MVSQIRWMSQIWLEVKQESKKKKESKGHFRQGSKVQENRAFLLVESHKLAQGL